MKLIIGKGQERNWQLGIVMQLRNFDSTTSINQHDKKSQGKSYGPNKVDLGKILKVFLIIMTDRNEYNINKSLKHITKFRKHRIY